jgi:predicted RNA methylase
MDIDQINKNLLDLSINPQSTGLSRNSIDKFYTKKSVVDDCILHIKAHINISNEDLIIEPSAGDGAFIYQIKSLSQKYLFYDIEPEHNEIVKQDFLELLYLDIKLKNKIIHIIGNPPFGRQSSTAVKFIKKCCEFADTISFILPKSFKKDSMKKHFALNYHLIFEIDLKNMSFLVNNIETDVPCVFQIWQWQTNKREIPIKQDPIDFKFVNKNDNPDVSFRRVGVNAGSLSREIENKSIQSHYFIKFTNDKSLDENIEQFKLIVFDNNNTVGPKSISKPELIEAYEKLKK